LHIARAGWQVEQQQVDGAPIDVKEKLVHHFCQHRSAPNDGGAGIEQQAHRDKLEAVRLYGNNAPALGVGFGAFSDAEHAGNIGAVDIGIDQSDAQSTRGECHGEVGAECRFANAALAARYGEHIFNAGDRLAVVCRSLIHGVYALSLSVFWVLRII